MLKPDDRMVLLDALRPPDGYSFDEGIGTTFSLDLLSLLVAPLAFTLFDVEDPTQNAGRSIEVLHSARQYAKRLTIFCQATRISTPKLQVPQYAFIEESVVECQLRNGGLFHPKVWVLRFMNSEQQPAYRLLCLSRNLSFSNSWDTVLLLEGQPVRRRVARNEPLAEFIRALPGLTLRPASEAVTLRAERFADEVRQVEWVLPEGLTDLRFWPLGTGSRRSWPFGNLGRRLLVISPFVSENCLERLARDREEATLVSTREDLVKLSRRPAGFTRYYELSSAAVADFLDREAAAEDADAARLDGLHAKCYVSEDGDQAHVWTGSANATDAAFNQNVEFLVELMGPRRAFGIDVLMAPEKGELRFGHLLEEAGEHVSTNVPTAEEEALRSRLERARVVLAETRFEGAVEADADGTWTQRVSGTLTDPLPEGVAVSCWPLPAPGLRATLPPQGEVDLAFPGLPLTRLSAFLAFRLEARAGQSSSVHQFVLTVPLEGLPSDRGERVLRELIKDTAALMRFLRLLLADQSEALIGLGLPDDSDGAEGQNGRWSHGFEPGLFELLVRALGRDPSRIDDVAHLIEDLGDDTSLLPLGFFEIWEPIWTARKEGARVPAHE